MTNGRRLYCDCGCGQVMAVEHADTVIVRARHHGREHELTINKSKLDITADESYADILRDLVMGSTN